MWQSGSFKTGFIIRFEKTMFWEFYIFFLIHFVNLGMVETLKTTSRERSKTCKLIYIGRNKHKVLAGTWLGPHVEKFTPWLHRQAQSYRRQQIFYGQKKLFEKFIEVIIWY